MFTARRSFLAGLSLAAVAGILSSQPAAALISFASLPPTAPTLLAPAAGATAETNANDPKPVLTWRHGGLYASFPKPATPTHWAICVYDAAVPTTCSDSNAQWLVAAGSVPSRLAPALGGGAGQYDYTFTPPTVLPSNLLDKAVRWTVGACSIGATAICTFTTPRDLWLSTVNLQPVSISTSSSNQRHLHFEADATNSGTSEFLTSAQYFTSLRVYHTLMTPGERCLKDANDASVRPTDQVVTTTGRLVTVSTLKIDMGTGLRVPPDDGIAAMYRPGAYMTPPIAFQAIVGSVPAGATRTIAVFDFNAPNTQPVPAAYTAIMALDATYVVREFNEADNVKAQCHVIH